MRRAIGGSGRAIAIRALLWSSERPTATDDAGVSIAHIGRAEGGVDSASEPPQNQRTGLGPRRFSSSIDCRGVVVGLARLELLGQVKT